MFKYNIGDIVKLDDETIIEASHRIYKMLDAIGLSKYGDPKLFIQYTKGNFEIVDRFCKDDTLYYKIKSTVFDDLILPGFSTNKQNTFSKLFSFAERRLLLFATKKTNMNSWKQYLDRRKQ